MSTFIFSGLSLLVIVAGDVGVFDPPFTFPSIGNLQAGKAPTEDQFGRACYNWVYGFLGSKTGPPTLPAGQILDKVMPACHQKDREGCQVFAHQLRTIVERKMKEKPMRKRPHERNGKPSQRKAIHVTKVEVEEAPQPEAQAAPAVEVKPAPVEVKTTTTAAPKAKVEESKAPAEDVNNYGMKVWKPKKHHDKSKDGKANLLSKASVAANHLMNDMETLEAPKAPVSLLSSGPTSYRGWCTNLWKAATASYNPPAGNKTSA